VTAATTGAAAQVGVAVAEVVVKDVILPAEVRAAAAELVTTRQRGLARLDAHPALATLRVVQSAPAGTQLVLRIEPAASGPTG
jgi:hypothetical protein